MADSSFRIKKSLNIEPKNAPTLNEAGDVGFDSADSKLKVHDGSSTDSVVTEAKSQSLTNKTIDADQNTITNIENADIKAGAAIAYSKLALSNSIVNADIANGAAIEVDKLEALTVSKALQTSASGVIEPSTVTSTELGYVAGVTSSIQTQLDSKQATGDYITDLTGDVTASGPGSVAATIANDAVTTVKIADNNVTNAKLADMATQTIKGRTTAGSGDPEDLTAAQATAILDTMVGDSGSGGTKGLVPAPAAGDAAANKFLKADGTWAVGGATITVKDENVDVDTATTTINFTGAGVVATQTSPGVVQVAISGGGGGGGSGGSDENYLLDQLEQDELDLIIAESVNSIRDDFSDAEKGTKTNTVQALSTLALATGQNSGSYERIRETSTVIGTAKGVARLQLQALAPDNNGLSSNVFTFSGDVSGYFSAGNTKVLICKKIVQEGNTSHIFLRADDEKIARLVASTVSYNSGTNKTSVTITNPGALDLDLDLTGSEYAEKLRVIPMTHDIQIKSRAASSYETADIADAHGSTAVSIPGQAAFLESINFTGTVIHHDVKFSPNGTYAVARILERVSPGDQWKFYGSSNKGISWTFLGTTSGSTGNTTEENSMQFQYVNQRQTAVADNGKWFSAYRYYNGSNDDVKGVYGDLTISSFSDVPWSGVVGTNAAGNICVTGSTEFCWGVSADTTDLSMIAVLVQQNAGSYLAFWYSNGGATAFATRNALKSSTANEIGNIKITGTAGSRRTWHTTYSGSAAFIGFCKEEDNFSITYNASGTASSDTNIGNWSVSDLEIHNNKLVIIKYLSSVNPCYQYISNATTGTPSGISAENTLLGLEADRYLGGTTQTGLNWVRNNRIYLNTDRLMLALDYAHGDGVRRTHVHEVRDITSYQGAHINATSAGNDLNFRQTTSWTFSAQTFTANTSRVRTVMVRAYQVGTIAAGHTLTCEIQATTLGAPNGTVIATSVNSYDPRNITKSSSGQNLFFTFNSPSLTNGVVYAIVMKSAFPINGSNYLLFKGTTAGSSYAGGQLYEFNGTSWTTPGTNFDYFFSIYGDWIYDLSHETRNESQEYGRQVWNQEATLAAIDSSTLRMAHRLAVNDGDVHRAKTGHVWTSLISLGSGSAASTYTAPAQIGYQSNAYDKNLVFSVIPGTDLGSRIDRTLGRVSGTSTTQKAEMVNGITNSAQVYDNSPTFVTDSSFQYGVAVSLNGTNQRISGVSNLNTFNFQSNYPFAIEAEFKIDAIGGSDRAIVAKYHSGLSHGWYLRVLTTGQIQIALTNTSGTTIGEARSLNPVISANTYYVVRITYAGDGSHPRILLSTTGPDGAFTDVNNYTSTIGFSGISGGSSGLRIGCIFSGSEINHFNGKIGYIKIANGSSQFVYNGAKHQHAHVGLINTGTKVFAEMKSGDMSNADMNQSYDEFGMIDPNGSSNAVVDSNDIYLVYDHTIAGTKGQAMYLKVNMARASATDVGAIKGINFKFSK